MPSSISLGKVFGIPIGFHFSWFIIFVLITLSLALAVFPQEYPSWAVSTYWIVGLITSLLFFASIVAHELMHSIVALNRGIPVKSITLFVFGGVSQITKEASDPRTEAVMAAAGPLTSLVLAGVLYVIFLGTQNVYQPVAAISQWLSTINLLLALFNFIPGFPMDGGRVFRAIVWGITGNYRQATHVASIVGRTVAYLFILIGILIIFTGNFLSGLWLAFIGWFLENAASSSYRQVELRDALKGFKARDLMTSDCSFVQPDTTLKDLVYQQILPSSKRCFLVQEDGQLDGIVTLHNVRDIPQTRWDTTDVKDAMTPFDKMKTVPPDEEAMAVLERMDAEDINQMPVVQDGRVVGMIARDSLIRFLRTRADLGV